jgi:flagellar biosynthesis protein FlhA
LIVLMFTPLPTAPLLFIAGAIGGIGYLLMDKTKKATREAEKIQTAKPKEPEKIENCLTVDPLELEVGYGLIKLVDRKQGGDLLDRIANVRRQIAAEQGIIVPPIRIRDNVNIDPSAYVLKLRGAPIARGELMPGHLLAIDSGTVTEPVHGIDTKEPSFGLPALWIPEEERRRT